MNRRHIGRLVGYAFALLLIVPFPLYWLLDGSPTESMADSIGPAVQRIQTAVWAETEAEQSPTPRNSTDETAPQPIPSSQTATSQTSAIAFSIEIPAIGLEKEIFAHVDPADKSEYLPILERAVAHGYHTALPSDPRGNTYLFAHSRKSTNGQTPLGGWFTRIDELETGDTINITYGSRVYTYTVANSEITDPLDVSVYRGSSIYEDHRSLTLQTCYPRGETDLRLIVYAVGE